MPNKKTKTIIGIILIFFGIATAAFTTISIPLTASISFSPAIFLTAIGAILIIEEIFAKSSNNK